MTRIFFFSRRATAKVCRWQCSKRWRRAVSVIVSEMASVGAVVEDNYNGFTIEPENVSQLVEILKFVLLDKVDLKEIGENARATVEERFNLSNYIEKLEKIYSEIAE